MRSDELKAWSRAVINRDGECVQCGAVVALHAHHIKPKSEFPELALDQSNGETLCANCHWLHHRHRPARGKRGPHAGGSRAISAMLNKISKLEEEVRQLRALVVEKEEQIRGLRQEKEALNPIGTTKIVWYPLTDGAREEGLSENGFHLMEY